MKGDLIKSKVLGVRYIPRISREMAQALRLKAHQKSLGLLTSTCDDVTYVALDEATKTADVEVVYARSFYAGSGNASTKLAGEVIGILAGRDPEAVRSGMEKAVEVIEKREFFVSANEDDSIVYFSSCISRCGAYLAKMAGVKEGTSLAYLIAPPLEAIYGLDLALKESAVKLKKFYKPPSETNFAGGLLTGSQSACQAACDSFARAVMQVAEKEKE